MEEIIKEELEKRYNNFLTIDVKYVRIKLYNIKIEIKVCDNNDCEVVRGFSLSYNWLNHFTTSSNIEHISRFIDKYIIKIFKEE